MLLIFENRASANGGGIYLCDDSDIIYTIRAQYRFLKAGHQLMEAGSINIGSYHCNITLHNQSMLQILENRASADGGEIYNIISSNKSLTGTSPYIARACYRFLKTWQQEN